jgi:uncharacterized BrkB/YihY/UPF0761 family membrane protein
MATRTGKELIFMDNKIAQILMSAFAALCGVLIALGLAVSYAERGGLTGWEIWNGVTSIFLITLAAYTLWRVVNKRRKTVASDPPP